MHILIKIIAARLEKQINICGSLIVSMASILQLLLLEYPVLSSFYNSQVLILSLTMWFLLSIEMLANVAKQTKRNYLIGLVQSCFSIWPGEYYWSAYREQSWVTPVILSNAILNQLIVSQPLDFWVSSASITRASWIPEQAQQRQLALTDQVNPVHLFVWHWKVLVILYMVLL